MEIGVLVIGGAAIIGGLIHLDRQFQKVFKEIEALKTEFTEIKSMVRRGDRD